MAINKHDKIYNAALKSIQDIDDDDYRDAAIDADYRGQSCSRTWVQTPQRRSSNQT